MGGRGREFGILDFPYWSRKEKHSAGTSLWLPTAAGITGIRGPEPDSKHHPLPVPKKLD